MNICIVVGARPNFIKVAPIIELSQKLMKKDAISVINLFSQERKTTKQ